jgi:hypothetical protein
LLGGVCALAALGAPQAAQIVAAAAALAYLLVGAAIVVPAFLVLRLLSYRRR